MCLCLCLRVCVCQVGRGKERASEETSKCDEMRDDLC